MAGDTTVEAPQQTPEEAALIAQQTQLLNQQQAIFEQAYQQQQMLQPLLLQQSGIVPVKDANGNITGYELAPKSEEDTLLQQLSIQGLQGQIAQQSATNQLLQQQLGTLNQNAGLRGEVEAATLERTLAALNGELPVDPSLVDELNMAERQLEERFAAQLGPGYQTSSPYIEAKNDFVKTKEQVLEAARRGEITSLGPLGFQMGQGNYAQAFGAPQSGLAGYAAQQGAKQQLLGNTSSLLSAPLQYGGAYGSVVQGLNSPLSAYQFDRNMQFQADAATAQANADVWSGIFGGVGTLGGMALGKWL